MRAEDAAAAAAAGAHAIGLVFHSWSGRCVSLDVARKIIAALPPLVTPVGLFVDSSASEILNTVSTLGLRTVQLHGAETPELVAQLERLTILKAVRADRRTLASSLELWRQAHRELPPGRFAGILLETAATCDPGGTGVENDWAFLESAVRDNLFAGLPPVIVAGGLTPTNVGDVVRRLRPYAVDVSSGIEETRGIKSVAKMRAFTDAVADADRD
jgi:phosphoribosylanthranilate isomerase